MWSGRSTGTPAPMHRLCGAALFQRRARSRRRDGEEHEPETHLIPLVLAAALGRRPQVESTARLPDAGRHGDSATTSTSRISPRRMSPDRHLLAQGRLVLNLGTGAVTALREVVRAAERVTGARCPIGDAAPAGDPPVLVADATRAQERSAGAPNSDLDSIIGTAWAWHRKAAGEGRPPVSGSSLGANSLFVLACL